MPPNSLRNAAARPLLSRRLEAEDGRGHGDVQRLAGRVHGNGQVPVHPVSDGGGQAVGFAAEDEGARRAQVGDIGNLAAGGEGGVDVPPGPGDRLDGTPALIDRSL